MFTVVFGPIKPELQTNPTRAFACVNASFECLPDGALSLSLVGFRSLPLMDFQKGENHYANDIFNLHFGSRLRTCVRDNDPGV